MEHEYWEERLQGYLDNELDPADFTAVENHVRACEDCEANAAYFRAMKKRLLMHHATVEMPQAVEERLHAALIRKHQSWRRFMLPGAGILLAAAMLVFAFLPEKPHTFEPATLLGHITCYDCAVAVNCGLEKGELCGDKHAMGMVAEDGQIWRFAKDVKSLTYVTNSELFGKDVQIVGSMLQDHHLVRIDDLKVVGRQQAAL